MILIDTHVLLWSANDDRRLGPLARVTIEAEAAAEAIFVSAITPWEVALLVHKGRMSLGRETTAWILEALGSQGVTLAPIEPEIAVDSVNLPGVFHADPADRLIVATARHHGWPLMTADRAILDYGGAGFVAVVDASM